MDLQQFCLFPDDCIDQMMIWQITYLSLRSVCVCVRVCVCDTSGPREAAFSCWGDSLLLHQYCELQQ